MAPARASGPTSSSSSGVGVPGVSSAESNSLQDCHPHASATTCRAVASAIGCRTLASCARRACTLRFAKKIEDGRNIADHGTAYGEPMDSARYGAVKARPRPKLLRVAPARTRSGWKGALPLHRRRPGGDLVRDLGACSVAERGSGRVRCRLPHVGGRPTSTRISAIRRGHPSAVTRNSLWINRVASNPA